MISLNQLTLDQEIKNRFEINDAINVFTEFLIISIKCSNLKFLKVKSKKTKLKLCLMKPALRQTTFFV